MSRASIGKLSNRKRSRGQTIYLTLIMLLVLAIMIFAAFDISQMTHGKAQTMNAADAGAYTAVTIVARDMNFMVYTNRAMVANHAVVGQIVTMVSLGRVLEEMMRNFSYFKPIGQILQYIPYVDAVAPVFEGVGAAAQAVETAIDKILGYMHILVQGQNAIIKALEAAQLAVLGETAATIENHVNAAIKANDNELEWDLAGSVGGDLTSIKNLTDGVKTFTDFTSARAGDDRFRQVVRDSRDGFTKERKWFGGGASIFGFDLSLYLFYGGTDMSADSSHAWIAVDAMPGLLSHLPIPGWVKDMLPDFFNKGMLQNSAITGDTHVSEYDEIDQNERYKNLNHGSLVSKADLKEAYKGQWWVVPDLQGNPQPAQDRLYKGANNSDTFARAYDGIQKYNYWDLNNKEIGKAGEHESPSFIVLVYKPVRNSTTPGSNEALNVDPNNPLHLEEPKDRIYGVAAAQVYFRSPTKDPSSGDLPNTLYKNGVYASLFSPYWQPRLTDVPPDVQTALAVFE